MGILHPYLSPGDDTFCVCDENQFVSTRWGLGECMDCPPNTFRDLRDNPADGQTYCTCPAGFLIQGEVSDFNGVGCRPCPANSTSTAQEMRGYQTSCYCKENFHADFDSYHGTCKPCPAGLTNAAGERVRDPDMDYCVLGGGTTY